MEEEHHSFTVPWAFTTCRTFCGYSGQDPGQLATSPFWITAGGSPGLLSLNLTTDVLTPV